jgi:CRISPR/Cas system-associated exonuclease Cas4 (RecB family)
MAYAKRFTQKYLPNQTGQYKLSRSKIEQFIRCPRCFWLDVRLKIKQPDTPPFQINKAVDELLKSEFDGYRLKQKPHPYMIDYGINAIPYAHNDLDTWRENFVGVQAVHEATNFLIFGAVDDVWVNPEGELIVVDYKATAKKSEVSLDSPWQIAYKRQMEIYQWLLRANGFKVSDTGYFVYCNGIPDAGVFNNKVEFRVKVIDYTGSDNWIDQTIKDMKLAMDADGMPEPGADCQYCDYARARTMLTLEALQEKQRAKKKP